MFSTRGLVELGKALAKVGVVGAHRLMVLLEGLTPQLMGLSREPLEQAIGHSVAADRLLAAGAVAAAWLIIAAIDVPFQLWQHAKDCA